MRISEKPDRLVAPALAAMTFLAFLPSLWNGFVDWDDSALLTSNPHYRGLGWPELKWMFSTFLGGHYIPLTWLSFGLDYVVWGLNPVGYHLTNLLLHIAATVLFFFVARVLLEKATSFSRTAVQVSAASAALFFAIHPLRVESVAWATERRDVLSGVLFLVTILLYVEASGSGGARRRRLLSASVGAYLLALLSKSMVMTLPAVLLVLDVYPLRRLTGGPRRWFGPSDRGVWLEKVPYAALGAAGAVVSYFAQTEGARPRLAPWSSRVINVLYSLWFYPFKTIVPVGLSPLYEAPAHVDLLELSFLASVIGVVSATLLALFLCARWPAGLALWVYYGIVVAPVSGVIPMGMQLVADRYSYLACLGWALLMGAGAGLAVRAAERGALRPALARSIAGAAVLGFLGLGVLTWRQAHIWRDTESLWRGAVSVTPDCSRCRINLAGVFLDQRREMSALEQLQWVLALRPDRVEFRARVGGMLVRLGMLEEAANEYRRVLERYPRDVDVRNNLAAVLLQTGRVTEAVYHLQQALEIRPSHSASHVTLGFALSRLGRSEDAVEHFQRAIQLAPDSAMARKGLVEAYVALGRRDLARDQYEALRVMDPPLADGAGSVLRAE